MVQQFAYVHEVIVISLFTEKNTRCSSAGLLSQNNTPSPNLNPWYFYIAHNSQWTKNGPKLFLGEHSGLGLHSMDETSENLPLKLIPLLYTVSS